MLARIKITSEQRFELLLRYGAYPGKEGELELCWQQPDSSNYLARISFTIIPDTGSLSIYIGGLQGPHRENVREAVAQASKVCNGLSPKRAVIEGLFAFAKHIGANTILAVSDDQQISRNKKSKCFSYDDFWLELGAQRNEQNDYLLPLHPLRRQLHETPTKRRAKYRRQHAHLDVIHEYTMRGLGIQ